MEEEVGWAWRQNLETKIQGSQKGFSHTILPPAAAHLPASTKRLSLVVELLKQ